MPIRVGGHAPTYLLRRQLDLTGPLQDRSCGGLGSLTGGPPGLTCASSVRQVDLAGQPFARARGVLLICRPGHVQVGPVAARAAELEGLVTAHAGRPRVDPRFLGLELRDLPAVAGRCHQ
jgi:hypothetical protein